MENKEIIKKALLFSGLADEYLVEVADIVVRRPFAKGESLFNEGDKAEGFYLLASGALKLCKVSPDGREKVLHMVHPVETFAEAAFFGDGNYPAEARGVEKGEVLFFPRGAFMGLLERNPRFSLNLIASLSLLLRRFEPRGDLGQIHDAFDIRPPVVRQVRDFPYRHDQGFCSIHRLFVGKVPEVIDDFYRYDHSMFSSCNSFI